LASPIVRVDVAPGEIWAGEKATVAVTLGAFPTVIEPDAADGFVAPWVLCTAFAAIDAVNIPGAALVKLTLTLHDAPAATLPPESESVVPLSVTLPPLHVVVGEPTVVIPLGIVPLKLTEVSETAPLPLSFSVNDNCVVPPAATGEGENETCAERPVAFVIVTPCTGDDEFDAPCPVVRAPAGIASLY
jgi:hypothetical protein